VKNATMGLKSKVALSTLRKHKPGFITESPSYTGKVCSDLQRKIQGNGVGHARIQNCLKGQSHEKVSEIIPLNDGLGPN
jgi:hypothetical protein